VFLQYSGVVCGYILTPLDAWLFTQINRGNCISLALNQGYGWAGDINLKFIFDRIFSVEKGSDYPAHRKEPHQAAAVHWRRFQQNNPPPLCRNHPSLEEQSLCINLRESKTYNQHFFISV
jgi:hypothetical protein